MEVKKVLETCRNAFQAGKTFPTSFRLEQLKNMMRMVNDNEEEILDALAADLNKSRFEALLYEIEIIRAEIKHYLTNLKNYVGSVEYMPPNALASLDTAFIQPEPYGVVLIIGPWNYPFSLSLLPLCGAIGAGNCVILKPSEIAAKSAQLMSRIIPKYLDKECFHVIEADLEGTKEMLKNKFDYIFATGSVNMGKSVMAAAAPFLTPLTLELGGKSPVYIDSSSNFELAAKRILWGKNINLGQTCIAPDYVLCSAEAESKFIKVAGEVMKEWYGTEWKKSSDLARIINKRNFLRLKKMLEETKGRIVFGGDFDEDKLYISPTIVVDVPETDILMSEEIFGPILPILRSDSPEAAIRLILSRQKPLSLYIFSENRQVIDKFLSRTSSGGVCINDVIWQNAWIGLPFGGVGESGMGTYHGKYSFETFSHRKPVLHRGFSYLSEKLGEARYPPYTQPKIRFFTFIIRYLHMFDMYLGKGSSHLLAGAIGACFLYFFIQFFKQ